MYLDKHYFLRTNAAAGAKCCKIDEILPLCEWLKRGEVMTKDSLYKVFAGYFGMLDERGNVTSYFKDKALFKNTYGLVFFIHSATKGRCYAFYFARDERGWNYRTVFPTGRVIEENNRVCIKTRYNTYVWDSTAGPTNEQVASLFQWVKEYGEMYIPGFTQHPGIKEYFECGHHCV